MPKENKLKSTSFNAEKHHLELDIPRFEEETTAEKVERLRMENAWARDLPKEWDKFAKSLLDGVDPREAYMLAYKCTAEECGKNHLKLLQEPRIRTRVSELRVAMDDGFVISQSAKRRRLYQLASLSDDRRAIAASVGAIRELNMMDGHHIETAKKLNINMNVDVTAGDLMKQHAFTYKEADKVVQLIMNDGMDEIEAFEQVLAGRASNGKLPPIEGESNTEH